ncbi:hypothetical protein L7F22_024474 [Adiantum nelumboides]|nr:hypothetical protein [Adiantum nelumboides]
MDVAKVVDVAGPSTRIAKIMNEEDDMDTFLAGIKDINEQLIFAGEIISDSSLVQIVLDALPDSSQTFASTWRLMNQRNPKRAVEQAFIAAQRRGGNSNATTSHGSFASDKSPVPNASSTSSSSGNSGDKGKKKMRCHYCKANDHLIKQCSKLKAKEAKIKEGGSTANADSSTNAAIVVSSVKEDFGADAKWAFSAKCTYNPIVHDACMLVAADSHVWYFDSGATKHITLHHDLFTSLESVPHGNLVTCANNASYPVQGDGKIVLTTTNGSSFTLVDTLYIPRIKKNILYVSALARLGLVVKFVDDRCTVHDFSFGDEIVASGILCRGLYKPTLYDKYGKNFANAVVDTKHQCHGSEGLHVEYIEKPVAGVNLSLSRRFHLAVESPSQCSPRLLSSPPAQKFHVLSLARLQAEFLKPDPEGEPLGESSLTDIRRVLGAPVERLRESWNQVSELSREQGEVTRRRVLGAPISKEPSKPFDVTDKRLQDAATTFQNALNATTVVEEERFWTEVIVKYGSLEAEWVADIVSRAYGNRGNARRKAGRGVRRLRQVNHACSVDKEDDLFAIYFYSTELGCYNRTSIMYAVDPVLNRGVVLESLGRYDEASADYVAVLRAQPKDPSAWNNIGNVKAAQNRWEDALIGYAKAVELAPSFSFAAANYALELYQVGRVNEAVKQFRSLLRKYPEFPDMRAALAVSLYAEGLTAEAESNWERLEDRRYRDRAWVKNTRRWPPRLANGLEAFLDVRSSRGSGA